MFLNNKTAIVYGAAGQIGTAISMAIAREGATVILTGRRAAPLELLACKIEQAGGKAELALVDALHQEEICDHADSVFKRYGSIDISFNAIGVHCGTGKSLSELSLYEFEEPALKLIRSNFLTATTAAKYITQQGSGSIIILTSSEERCLQLHKGGFLAAYKGLEAFSTQLALEIEPVGGRVVSLCYSITESKFADVPICQSANGRKKIQNLMLVPGCTFVISTEPSSLILQLAMKDS